jgi:hypothetical protein
MREKEFFTEITRIGDCAHTLRDATERIQSMLAAEIRGASLLVGSQPLSPSIFQEEIVTRFLESREYPFRGVYTATVRGRQGRDGCLVACFGSWGAPGDLLQRISTHIADSLGILLRTSRIYFPAREEAV